MRGCCRRSRSLGSEGLKNDDQRSCRAVCRDEAKARLPVHDQRTDPVELRALRRRSVEAACIRSETVLEWAVLSGLAAPHRPQTAHCACLCVLDAGTEDSRHEVPPRHAFGRLSYRRPPPHRVSIRDIRRLLEAALRLPPAGTITPLTWHRLFGLMASTGLRISEASRPAAERCRPGRAPHAAKPSFRKSRMVALPATVRDAARSAIS